MRVALVGLVSAVGLLAAEGNPILRWLVNPAASTTSDAGLRAILPNVHSVRVDGRYVVVESAGLSLQSLGPLEVNDREPPAGVRRLVFRFPLKAAAEEGHHARTPLGIVGAFLNGVPLYTPVSAVSYHGQDLWHRDAAAQASAGRSPLLASLLESGGRHSPLIGFALDGYPIYGPFGEAGGAVRRFRSSYRLRAITRRMILPDGTELTPSQEGPAVSAEFPLGTFVEDYEYAPGSGDLDEYNGRLARTPEYPEGTYAYFLGIDAQGKMMYPYLVGPMYFGHVEAATAGGKTSVLHDGRVDLATGSLQTGQASPLTFTFRDGQGRRIRFLERVHEQPIHLVVVSADLSEFAHIHPVLQPDDTFQVNYAFLNGGTYWLYVDHTPPGGAQTISRFCVQVQGAAHTARAMRPDAMVKTADGLRVRLTLPDEVRVGRDLNFRFDVADAETNLPVGDLEPYLGAWAHIMVVSQDRRNFIHAHPVEETAANDPWVHSHVTAGPSPSTVSTVTGFRTPGMYRLWIQFQRSGRVITVPFSFRVEGGGVVSRVKAVVPPDAVRVRVSDAGFEPARIWGVAGKAMRVAFQRLDAQNCANAVVFPELGIRKTLAPGATVVVEIPASGAREYSFACGMNMFRGALVIR